MRGRPFVMIRAKKEKIHRRDAESAEMRSPEHAI